MSDADEHRSTPGYVYGVASHCNGQEVGKPDCSCPCHVAESPWGATGWYCDQCASLMVSCSTVYNTGTGKSTTAPKVEYSHEQAIADGNANPRPYMVSVVEYYFITKGNTLADELQEHFETRKEAEERANERNNADVVATLNLTPESIERRNRLKALGKTFWVRYGVGPVEARWPKEPGRYAVESFSDRYSSSFWETCDTLDDVKAEVEGGDVERVVDLDTGSDVPFKVAVVMGCAQERVWPVAERGSLSPKLVPSRRRRL